MPDAKPPVVVDLRWSDGRRFEVTSRAVAFVLDGDSTAGPSPVQMLAASLAGCMSIDVVDILRRGRHPVTGFRATLTGERAPEIPTRLTGVRVHFTVQGDVPPAAVERAIALSHDKYCSVWHSLRQDIAFDSSFDIEP
jgi:putative redox protein